MRVLEDRLAVRVDEAVTTTISGLLLPEKSQEKPNVGTVTHVGPGRLVGGERQAMDLAVGDRVIFPKFVGTQVSVAGEKLLVLREGDVIAALANEQPEAASAS